MPQNTLFPLNISFATVVTENVGQNQGNFYMKTFFFERYHTNVHQLYTCHAPSGIVFLKCPLLPSHTCDDRFFYDPKGGDTTRDVIPGTKKNPPGGRGILSFKIPRSGVTRGISEDDRTTLLFTAMMCCFILGRQDDTLIYCCDVLLHRTTRRHFYLQVMNCCFKRRHSYLVVYVPSEDDKTTLLFTDMMYCFIRRQDDTFIWQHDVPFIRRQDDTGMICCFIGRQDNTFIYFYELFSVGTGGCKSQIVRAPLREF